MKTLRDFINSNLPIFKSGNGVTVSREFPFPADGFIRFLASAASVELDDAVADRFDSRLIEGLHFVSVDIEYYELYVIADLKKNAVFLELYNEDNDSCLLQFSDCSILDKIRIDNIEEVDKFCEGMIESYLQQS